MVLSTEAGVKQDPDKAAGHPCCSVERLKDLNLLVDQIINRIACRRRATFHLSDVLPKTSRKECADAADGRQRGVAVRSEVLRLFGILCTAIIFAWMLVIVRHSLGTERIGDVRSFGGSCDAVRARTTESTAPHYRAAFEVKLPPAAAVDDDRCVSVMTVVFDSISSLVRDMPARQ